MSRKHRASPWSALCTGLCHTSLKKWWWPEFVMPSGARAQVSKRRCVPGYIVGEGCKEVCLMPFPLLWLPRKTDSAAEAGELQNTGGGQSLSQHSPSPCLWLPSLDTPGPVPFSLAPMGRKISVCKTRGKRQAEQKQGLEDQAIWRTQHRLCRDSPGRALPGAAPRCHLCSAPGHTPGIQTQSAAGACQRGDPNGSETLCHFCSSIFLAREWLSRKWKVFKELFMNMALTATASPMSH